MNLSPLGKNSVSVKVRWREWQVSCFNASLQHTTTHLLWVTCTSWTVVWHAGSHVTVPERQALGLEEWDWRSDWNRGPGWTLRCLFRSCHSVSQLYKLVSKAIKKNHLPYVLSFVEMKTALGTALYSAREFSPFTYKLQRLSTHLHVHIIMRTHTHMCTCAHVYRWSMYTGGLHKYWMTTHLWSTLSRWL